MELFIIVESNFLFDIYLSRDRSSAYLMNLASKGKIKIAIPEYSLAEADGQEATLFYRRKKKLTESISLVKELSRSDYTKKYSLKAIENLTALLNAIDEERNINYETIKIIRDICIVIPHTPEIHVKAHLRDLSSKPPFKFNDCQIYSAALDFAGKNKEDYKIIFLTKDRDDFNYEEIHKELKDSGVKLMFSSGDCVKEVMRLID